MGLLGRSRSVRSDEAGRFIINGVVGCDRPVLLSPHHDGRVSPAGAADDATYRSRGELCRHTGFVGGAVGTETIKGVT